MSGPDADGIVKTFEDVRVQSVPFKVISGSVPIFNFTDVNVQFDGKLSVTLEIVASEEVLFSSVKK